MGEIILDPAQSRHARDVLRLADGAAVEMFDDAGARASGALVFRGEQQVAVRIERVEQPASAQSMPRLTVASAVPKGERADWMVEKLSELGVAQFIALAAHRSIVLPEGKGKHQRWERIAIESAKQSHRAGVMRIGRLTPLEQVLRDSAATGTPAFVLSMSSEAISIHTALRDGPPALLLLIGPEGGWTDVELSAFRAARVGEVRLTDTILRVETAAVAAAAVVMTYPTAAMIPGGRGSGRAAVLE